MINRLVYEVRLKPLDKKVRSKMHKKWRWDVTYYKTTDPTNPGVEDGRWHLGHDFGYERFKWKALGNIAYNIEYNLYKEKYEER